MILAMPLHTHPSLLDLLYDLEIHEAIPDLAVSGLKLDSRDIEPGDVFVALAGTKAHGMAFCQQAIKRGAAAVLYDPSGGGWSLKEAIAGQYGSVYIAVNELDQKLGIIAKRFYENSYQHLKIIGITGTNGKTSCSHFLAQALEKWQHCGIIGTLGWGFGDALHFSRHTTPDAIELQRQLSILIEEKAEVVSMEVSSHALAQGRVNAVEFYGAVFTNISRDHLDYHGTFNDYLGAKLKLFSATGLRFVVINLDDPNAGTILDRIPQGMTIFGFSQENNANTRPVENINIINAEDIIHLHAGLEFTVRYKNDTAKLTASIIGDFNVDNILACAACLIAMGYGLQEAVKMLRQIKAVPGRLERVPLSVIGVTAIVDYAHTPQALEKALVSVKRHCRGNLFVVFGCGGDRDSGKRAEMGKIAEQLADRIILTDDNPRYEDGAAIIADILQGCSRKYISVVRDRYRAIECAINAANENDMILIAGKGHENYQEISGRRIPFSDRKAIAAIQPQGESRVIQW